MRVIAIVPVFIVWSPGTNVRIPLPQTEAQPNISKSAVQEDGRLLRKVTLTERSISIRDLLSRLGNDTGVELATEERDGSADVAVSVYCSDLPLHKLLNSIWALVSYKPGLWRWERLGTPDGFKYRLSQPAGARRLHRDLAEWIQNRLEWNAATLIAAVDSNQEDRSKAMQSVYGYDTEAEDLRFRGGKLWRDIAAVKDALSPQDRSKLLRQGKSFEVPISALRPQVRDAFLQEWRDRNGRGVQVQGGIAKSLSEPETIRFERRKYGSTPTVYVLMSGVPAPPQFGGIPLESAYREYVRSIWMLDGDSKDSMTSKTPIDTPPGAVASAKPRVADLYSSTDARSEIKRRKLTTDVPTTVQELAKRLEEVALGSKVPLIARLPQDPVEFFLTAPRGQPIRDYWKQLWNKPIMVKWRDGVQLLSTQTWPMEDLPVPQWLVRSLRREAQPGKLLPLEYLIDAAAMLSRAQILRLKSEFPVMEQVAAAQGMLAFIHNQPALSERAQLTGGLPLNRALLALIRDTFPRPLAEVVETREPALLRVRIVTEGEAGVNQTRELIFELLEKDGRRIKGLGLIQ